MANTYNTVGSLTTVMSHLYQHKITEFQSLDSVINFQKRFPSERKQIILDQDYFLEKEKIALSIEIPELENFIETKKNETEKVLSEEIQRLKQEFLNLPSPVSNNFLTILNSLKKILLKAKIFSKEFGFKYKVSYSIRQSNKLLAWKKNRFQYLDLYFSDAVNENCKAALSDLDRKKSVVDEMSSFIYGAIGEQKVANILEKLPDEFYLINDFTLYFEKPIYYRQENAYIKSIQVDHLLISPSGVFIIETKNWSEESINNLSLRSPVDQIRRSSFVLFKILSEESSNSIFSFNSHHWGARKIPIRNLIVLINRKPKEEFQYVKVLTLIELTGYVKYFKPIFSNEETEEIAEYLLGFIK